jgi:hypothetical protein
VKPPSNPAHLSADGFVRTQEADARINQIISATFKTGSGKETLAYLRSITQQVVCTPDHSDAYVRHMEGKRDLVAIIMKRIEEHDNAERQRSRKSST